MYKDQCKFVVRIFIEYISIFYCQNSGAYNFSQRKLFAPADYTERNNPQNRPFPSQSVLKNVCIRRQADQALVDLTDQFSQCTYRNTTIESDVPIE